MSTPPLTKSQFKLGLDCIQKLRHARAGLAQNTNDNDLLRLLSEGGAAVEALQRAIEPGAYTGGIGHASAAEESMHHIGLAFRAVHDGAPRVSLYEVTIELDGFLARIDLLRVLHDRLELVEMKAKTRPDEGILTKKGGIRSEWLPYMQDIGFQHELLRQWIARHHATLAIRADFPIFARLLVVDRAGTAAATDILNRDNFRSSYRVGSRGTRATVEYVGDPHPASTAMLCELPLDDELKVILGCAGSSVAQFKDRGIADCMVAMRAIIDHDVWPSPSDSLGAHCRTCEFRVDPPETSGFARCWGLPAFPTHHVADLARISEKQFAEALEEHGAHAAIADLAEGSLRDAQLQQWSAVTSGRPIVDPTFAADPIAAMVPAGWTGQVWFLDFETSAYPIPGRVGGHPYEHVPFQFEGHALPSPTAPLRDRMRLDGFLELGDPDPRRCFVDALRAQLAGDGPVFHWHFFERVVLNRIRTTIEAESARAGDAERIAFIESMVGPGGGGGGRLVDLLPIAQRAFYHPDQRGSYSIKRVVPIAWAEPAIRAAFTEGHGAAGDPDWYSGDSDPYDGLPAPPRDLLDELGGDAVVRKVISEDEGGGGIRNGGMAMLAYHHARMFDGAGNPEINAQLRRYCRLDSAAMVMVYGLMRDVVSTWPGRG